MSTAQNAGRTATLQAAPEAVYYASEVLDRNTCEPCREIDGSKLGGLDEVARTYTNGGFVDCKGFLRCRGTVIAVWEEPDTLAAPNLTVPVHLKLEGRHAARSHLRLR